MNVMTIMVDKVCLDFPIAHVYLDGKVVEEYDDIREAANQLAYHTAEYTPVSMS